MNFTEHYNDHNRIAVYPGRYCPWHKNHYESYQNIVKEFGKDNVYIAATDKVDLPTSPFTFIEKKQIITTMFPDIPEDKIIQVKNPYTANEIVDTMTEDTTYVTVLGEKDSNRLTIGGYFEMYDNKKFLESHKHKGYVFVAPPNTTIYNEQLVSGTLIREIFAKGSSEERQKLFNFIYPEFNKEVFDLIINKIEGNSLKGENENG